MRARRTSHERGAALLIVMVAVAVLTALATELAYETRLSLRIAANARDDLRAGALAKGGVALSRLVLGFQQQVDATMGKKIPNVPLPAMPRPQIWRIVPVSSALADGLFGGAGGGVLPVEGAAGEQPAPSRPPPAGDFEAQLEDEARKVNVNFDNSDAVVSAQAQALYQLVCDPRWDALFDREDENGLRVSRQELLVYLNDWVDPNEEASALVASFPAGGCVMLAPLQKPFERGFQDENFPYDRGEDRYKAKNARMDSLAELHLVAGVTDAFVAAFGDAITVHLKRDAKLTVNAMEPLELLTRARLIAEPTAANQQALLDPEFLVRLQRLVLERTRGFLSLTPGEFADLVDFAGVTVNRNVVADTNPNNPLVDRSTAFRVRSVGRAGDVTKRIEAVVWLDDPNTTPGAAAAAVTPTQIPGKLVHWREE